MFKPFTVLAASIVALGVLPVLSGSAGANSGARGARGPAWCLPGQLQITGGNVAIRRYPNKEIIRVVKRGTVLRGPCNQVGLRSMRYASKCGRGGQVWFEVVSGRVYEGSRYGWVPATCVRRA
ncbi:hypothetical protein ACWEPC_23650 [Nonomuraea sp. NPDC004297]